ncbi:GntR family transcriptional regulator [Leekyejoonella antrihumi]|nr:GntR family transcriptional regulator [Leekyejoonella antrihumi]
MSTAVAAEHPVPASERAYSHIKAAILSGALAGGTFVTEGALAEEIGISRTPVREALLRLQVEDMVELYPKKGALVVPVTARETREVFEARVLIEEWAATHAWPRRAELGPRLHQLLDDMTAARRIKDAAAFSAADRAFHEVIVEAAGNSVITRQYRHLRDRQLCIVASVMRTDEARMTRAVVGHKELLALLEHGTRAEFTRAAREHVAHTGEMVGSR